MAWSDGDVLKAGSVNEFATKIWKQSGTMDTTEYWCSGNTWKAGPGWTFTPKTSQNFIIAIRLESLSKTSDAVGGANAQVYLQISGTNADFTSQTRGHISTSYSSDARTWDTLTGKFATGQNPNQTHAPTSRTDWAVPEGALMNESSYKTTIWFRNMSGNCVTHLTSGTVVLWYIDNASGTWA